MYSCKIWNYNSVRSTLPRSFIVLTCQQLPLNFNGINNNERSTKITHHRRIKYDVIKLGIAINEWQEWGIPFFFKRSHFALDYKVNAAIYWQISEVSQHGHKNYTCVLNSLYIFWTLKQQITFCGKLEKCLTKIILNWKANYWSKSIYLKSFNWPWIWKGNL